MIYLRQAIQDFANTVETHPQYAHLLNFTPHQAANDLILANPNAFLYGAIADQPTAVELKVRLCQFSGINQKISAMITALLVSQFKVSIRDFQDSDVGRIAEFIGEGFRKSESKNGS